tara:strand:+ start:10120 stop:10374 length:255 start_codon:yes stop_codon:yes gene_type:complete
MAGNVRILYLTQLKTNSQPFITGDATGDGVVNVLDVVSTVNYILTGSDDEAAEDSNLNPAAMDINGDGVVNILDVVAMVNFILS